MPCIRLLVVLAALLGLKGAPTGVAQAEDELDKQVTEFFQTADAAGRGRLLNAIAQRPDADVARVAEAIGRVQVWEPASSGITAWEVELGEGQRRLVRVRVPEGYDLTRRYPLILALHGMGQSALSYVQYVQQVLGDEVEKFIIAAPQDYKGTWFLATQAESAEPVAILAALRHRYHLDSDRVYANGYSMGGHAAFMCAVLYTDWFASAIPLASTFTTPETPETKPILLPNLAGFPMLLVWGEHDTRVGDLQEAGGGIAGSNRTLRAELPQMGIDGVEFIELPDRGHHDVIPPRDRFLHYLQLRRDDSRKSVAHWFRFPPQGRMGWLRQTKFAGEPWEGQLVVRVRPGGDVREYARRTVQNQLALLEGTIEGQTIRVRLQHTEEAEILLHEGLIDLAKPVTVYRGKKIVWEGPVQPKVSTMLELAYADWEFQRLASVRMVVPARGKARQE
jgi:predicted esterase